MKRIVILRALLAIIAAECVTLAGTSGNGRDYLIGWYQLPNRPYRTREIMPGPGTLIPVLNFPAYRWIIAKKGGKYLLEMQMARKEGWKPGEHAAETLEGVRRQSKSGYGAMACAGYGVVERVASGP